MATHSLRRGESPASTVVRLAAIAAANHAVNTPDLRILDVLAMVMAHYNATSCFPSHKKIATKLREMFGRVMSVRTLIRHLNALERDGWLARYRRHRYSKPARRWEFHSTKYVPLWRWTQRLASSAGRFAKILKRALESPSAATSRVTKMADTLQHLFRFAVPGARSSP